MIARGIVIKWGSATEYIYLDTGATKEAIISTTLEWWPSERKFVQYNTISRFRKLKDGTGELILYYRPSDNQHIARDDACWGKSTIKFKPNSTEGFATWRDFDDPAHNGTAQWQRISDGLVKKQKREYYSRLKREQEMFRAAILTYEQCCALSGESTLQALEVAHIIPSKDGGAEVVENGILLRADLHNLYDSGCFLIDQCGHVAELTGLSETYRKLLSKARLPESTVARVRKALIYQWGQAQQVNATDAKGRAPD